MTVPVLKDKHLVGSETAIPSSISEKCVLPGGGKLLSLQEQSHLQSRLSAGLECSNVILTHCPLYLRVQIKRTPSGSLGSLRPEALFQVCTEQTRRGEVSEMDKAGRHMSAWADVTQWANLPTTWNEEMLSILRSQEPKGNRIKSKVILSQVRSLKDRWSRTATQKEGNGMCKGSKQRQWSGGHTLRCRDWRGATKRQAPESGLRPESHKEPMRVWTCVWNDFSGACYAVWILVGEDQ
ncbi:hypothetical protein AAY473_008825 [Plecturocebus cupreus]